MKRNFSRWGISAGARIALSTAVALITLAELIGDGTVGLLLGVISFTLIASAMFSMPMRVSVLGLTFLALTLPNPGEGTPTPWHPPFSMTGQALMTHLNTLDRGGVLGSVPVSCMELFFFVLFCVHLLRKGARLSEGEAFPSPKPLLQLAYVSLATTGFTWLRGLVIGGDFAMSLWQVNAVMYLPVIFLLKHVSLSGPASHAALARVYIWAAIYKSLLAVYVVMTAEMPVDPATGLSNAPPYATSHSDSMLFAVATILVLAQLLERFDRAALKLGIVTLPILFAGMVANNRRLVWVQIGVVLLMIFIVSRESRLKRILRRAAFVLVPVAVVYTSAGWESRYGKFYRPVQILRSVVDTETDGSSMWRELENFNLVQTFRFNPMIGSGYGHAYLEYIPMPAVDYSLEHYIPHNSLLGLWAFGGLLGFAGLTMLWIAGNYFAMRAYRNATDPNHRVAAVVSFGALPIYLVQCWGDLGLGSWTGIFIMASSICVAGKLAVALDQSPAPSG